MAPLAGKKKAPKRRPSLAKLMRAREVLPVGVRKSKDIEVTGRFVDSAALPPEPPRIDRLWKVGG